MSQLAINGGNKIREKAWPKWPIVGESEIEQMTATIKSGIWGYNGAVTTDNREFAEKLDALRNCGRKPGRIMSESSGR